MEPKLSQEHEHLRSSHRLTHVLFTLGIAFKGLFGVLDTIAGAFFFSTSAVTDLIFFLAKHELGEDPSDFVAQKFFDMLPYFSVHTQFFIAWYFLIHGLLNIVLVLGLLRKKLWAYPAYMTVLLLFMCYQVFRILHTHSLTLLIVTLYDVVLLWLVHKEYRFVRTAGP